MRLYLDDMRHNYDSLQMLGYVIYKEEWSIVRSYDEFTQWIIKNGLPEIISFDHDLADAHYTPQEYWDDYHRSKEYQDGLVYEEKTGLDCANWLIDYCIMKELKLPKYLVHSANPVGRDNIFYLLRNFEISQNEPKNNNPDFDITDTFYYQSKRVHVAAKRFVVEFIKEFKRLFGYEPKQH